MSDQNAFASADTVVDVAAIVSEPPTTFREDTLEHELRPDPPSKRALQTTKILAFAATLVVGVLLGVGIDRQWGPSSGTSNTPGNGNFGNNGTFPGGDGNGPPGGFTGPPPGGTAPGGTAPGGTAPGGTTTNP